MEDPDDNGLEIQERDFKRNLISYIYQVKLLLIFLWRGWKNKYTFYLETEVKDAEKFDDLVFTYSENGKTYVNYLQAKYCRDDNIEDWKYSDFAVNNGKGSLKKYFTSFRKIKQKYISDFKEHFILCSDRTFKNLAITQPSITGSLQFRLQNSADTIYNNGKNIKENMFYGSNTSEKWNAYCLESINDEIYNKLKAVTNLSILAEEIASVLVDENNKSNTVELDMQNFWFSSYHQALINENIVIENQEIISLKKWFVENNTVAKIIKFSDNTELKLNDFRQLFFDEFSKKSKLSLDVVKLNEGIVQYFSDQLKLPSSNLVIQDRSKVDELIQTLIKYALNEIKQPDQIFKDNIGILKEVLRKLKRTGFSEAFVNEFSADIKIQNFRHLLFEKSKKNLLKKHERQEYKVSTSFIEKFKNEETISTHDIPNFDEVLAEYIFYKKELTEEIISKNNINILKNIFYLSESKGTVNFAESFLKGVYLSDEIYQFREAFLKAYFQHFLRNTELVFKINEDGMNKLAEIIKEMWKLSQNDPEKILFYDDEKYGKGETKKLLKSLNGYAFETIPGEESMVKFMDSFFDDTAVAQEAKLLKRKLKKVFGSNFLLLREYKIQVTNFPKLFDVLPENENIDDDINEFQEKFLVVTSTTEQELSITFKNELGSKFDRWISYHAEDKLLQWILRFAQGKQGECVTYGDVHKFFDEIKQHESVFKIDLLTSTFLKEMEAHNIQFENEFSEMQLFLDYTPSADIEQRIFMDQILLIKTTTPLLTSIRVGETLQSSFSNHFIFCSSSSMSHYKVDAALAFESDTIKIFALTDEQNLTIDETFCYRICDILHTNNAKKMIVITTNEPRNLTTILQNSFKLHKPNIEALTENINFNASYNDVTVDTKLELRKKVIEFQGVEMTLDSFANETDKIIELLSFEKFVTNNSVLKIGKPIENFLGYNEFYKERQLFHCSQLSEDPLTYFKENVVYFIENEINDTTFLCEKGIHKHQHCKCPNMENRKKLNIFIMNKSECYKEYKNSNTDKENKKWLKCENWCLFEVQECSDNSLDQNVCNQKVVIISDMAGMGKSSYLTNLAKKMKTFTDVSINPSFLHLWIVRIDLNNHTKQLSKAIENEESAVFDDIILKKALSSGENDYEKLIFNHYKEKGKVLFLFDGFDEIAPNYNGLVMKMLQYSTTLHNNEHNNANTVWVTTRTEFQESLEKLFHQHAYWFEAFDKEKQIEFLSEYWQHEYRKMKNLQSTKEISTEKFNFYSKIVVENYESTSEQSWNDFLGIPLQLKMLADVFERKSEDSKVITCFEFVDSNEYETLVIPKLNLFELYDGAMERKISLHIEKRDIVKHSTPDGKILAKNFKKKQFKICQAFGLKRLLSSNKYYLIEKFMPNESKLHKWRQKHTDGLGNVGIITTFADDGQAHFIHLTYAEYFAASFIVREICFKQLETKSDEAKITYLSNIFQAVEDIIPHTTKVFLECIIGIVQEDMGKFQNIIQLLCRNQWTATNFLRYQNFCNSLISNYWYSATDDSGTWLYDTFEEEENTIKKYHPEICDMFLWYVCNIGTNLCDRFNNSINLIDTQSVTTDFNYDFCYSHFLIVVYYNKHFGYFDILLEYLTETKRLLETLLCTIDVCGFWQFIICRSSENEENLTKISQTLLKYLKNYTLKWNESEISSLIETKIICGTMLLAARKGFLELLKILMDLNYDSSAYIDLYLSEACYYSQFSIAHYISRSYKEDVKFLIVSLCSGTSREFFDQSFSNFNLSSFLLRMKPKFIYQYEVYVPVLQKVDGTLKCIDNFKPLICNWFSSYANIEYLIQKGIDLKNNRPRIPTAKKILLQALRNNDERSISWILEYWPYAYQFEDFDAKVIFSYYNYKIKNPLSDSRKFFLFYCGEHPWLHTAVLRSDFEAIEFLLQKGADVDQLDKRKKRPLEYACENGNIQIVKLLLYYGANYCIKNKNIFSDDVAALLKAVDDIFERNISLDGKAIEKAKNNKKQTILHRIDRCIRHENIMLEFPKMFYCPYDVYNAADDDGVLPSEICYRKATNDVFTNVLKNGAIYNRDKLNQIASSYGEDKINKKNFELISSINTAFDSVRDENISLLQNAFGSALLGLRFYLPIRDVSGRTLLHCVRDMEIAKYLLAIRKKSMEEYYNQVRGHENLINQGISDIYKIIFYSNRFQSPRIANYAFSKQFEKLLDNIQVLFRDDVNEDQRYPGIISRQLPAFANAFKNKVKKWYTSETDCLKIRDIYERTPLYYIVESNNADNDKWELFLYFLENGAEFNADNYEEISEFNKCKKFIQEMDNMFIIISSKKPDIQHHIQRIQSEYEIKIKILVNISDKKGNTLLHYAYKWKQRANIEFLIKNGADSTIQNNDEKFPNEMMQKPLDVKLFQRTCGPFTLEEISEFDRQDLACQRNF